MLLYGVFAFSGQKRSKEVPEALEGGSLDFVREVFGLSSLSPRLDSDSDSASSFPRLQSKKTRSPVEENTGQIRTCTEVVPNLVRR